MSTSTVFAVLAPLPELALRGSERVARQSSHARLAVHASAGVTGATLGALEKNVDDVPLPSAGWFWSPSHSRASVAGVVHRAAVGIDVEDAREVRTELRERVLNPAERALLDAHDAVAFLRAWTAKEALLKELHLGLGGLARCSIVAVETSDTMLVTCDGARRRVRQFVSVERVASVSTADDASVTWVILAAPFESAVEVRA